MDDSSVSSTDSDSEEELREAFLRGDLKPGLNIEFQGKKEKLNNAGRMLEKLEEIKLNLPWVEQLDMVNDLAPLAPELVLALEKHEQKRANQFKGNANIPYVRPEEDPVLNDFKREMIFYRQAQAAVVEGIKQLHKLNVPTKRPDDYFAEMAKTDEHMQKVRANLVAKQEGKAKSERIRQIREQRKIGKMLQRQAKVDKEMSKKELLDQLKKFRKGKLKNLDFLEDAKVATQNKKASKENRKDRDKKFGFGGKKRGLKRNTKESSANIFGNAANRKGSKNVKTKRLGKGRRKAAKAKGRK